jgi:hypothetical protein
MSKNTPTSWIIFLFITGFIFIGYGVRGTARAPRVGASNPAEVVSAVENRSDTAEIYLSGH